MWDHKGNKIFIATFIPQMQEAIQLYNDALPEAVICNQLAALINENLNFTENKIWHAHPVWFINGNPIVGYSKQKAGIRLMFWSGADFDEDTLQPGTGKFKDASIFFTEEIAIDKTAIKRMLKKAETIQWDYKNIVKRKGRLERL
jgi:Domain of unknown function (DU1801)